jgi:23S rRNA (adenine2030-N6)-methyltransferase
VNYRHAYHAGNFADCMKHALLVWLLQAMARKDTPFLVLDTHAGTGATDLNAAEPQRTGEAASGILRLLDAPDPALSDYLAVIRACGLYPGSPAIAQALLRPPRGGLAGDRLVCCELHPEDFAVLRRRFARARQVSMHHRDGYEALTALLPPPERRGLILIDPPYEAPDEFDRLAARMRAAHARFPTGVYAAWYPIKHRAPVRAFHAAIQQAGIRDVVAAELALREPVDAARLNGCGLLVVNPPWRFEAAAQPILTALLAHLGNGEPGAGASMLRLADE